MPQISELETDQKRAIDHVRTRFFWQHYGEMAIMAKHEGVQFETLVREVGQIDAMFAILADQTRVLPIYLMTTLRQLEREALEECEIAQQVGRWN